MLGKKITKEEFDALPDDYYAMNLAKYRSGALKVYRAIKRGILVRPSICEEKDDTCSGPIDACHYTYDRPLLVRWLCRSHHRRWDIKRALKPGESYAF